MPTAAPGADAFVPDTGTLDALRRAAEGCRGCDLWRNATQVVFGEGPASAEMLLVGEQPGDQEDRQGRPFVGPAGHVLDRALERAGIDPARIYKTNVVKHFKHEMRGKRRIHKTPGQIEIVACQPWFAAELDRLHPDVLVLLGAVAGRSVLGSSFRVTRERGRPIDGPRGIRTVATVHPSSILRAPDDQRTSQMDALVADLRTAAGLLDS